MKDFIISPPFGNFVTHPKCISIMGTYTLNRRGGWLKKIYRAILTIRPIKNGWINNIGLQNPGIKSVRKFHPDKIYSIAAIEIKEWDELISLIPKETKLELNLSCPNVHQKTVITDKQIRTYLNNYDFVIFKLSPIKEIHSEIDRLINLGVEYVHIANAFPTDKGGESGGRLKEFSIKVIKETKNKYPSIKVIGGGGIYSFEDVAAYKNAGADYFSLASIWFNPLKAIQLLKQI
ncbi:MAG TPA: hypothetical protein VGC58_01110 [Candidatus Paceibacterota bacterium]